MSATPDRDPAEPRRALERYLDLFVHSSGAAPGREQVEELVCEDFSFSDPFNRISGPGRLAELLAKTRREVPDARFDMLCIQRVEDAGPGRQATWLVKWRFVGRVAVIGQMDFVGMSEIVQDLPSGRISRHVDFWDAAAAFYARLPVFGPLVRLLGRRARLRPPADGQRRDREDG